MALQSDVVAVARRRGTRRGAWCRAHLVPSVHPAAQHHCTALCVMAAKIAAGEQLRADAARLKPLAAAAHSEHAKSPRHRHLDPLQPIAVT